jgi:hypothetical protein
VCVRVCGSLGLPWATTLCVCVWRGGVCGRPWRGRRRPRLSLNGASSRCDQWTVTSRSTSHCVPTTPATNTTHSWQWENLRIHRSGCKRKALTEDDAGFDLLSRDNSYCCFNGFSSELHSVHFYRFSGFELFFLDCFTFLLTLTFLSVFLFFTLLKHSLCLFTTFEYFATLLYIFLSIFFSDFFNFFSHYFRHCFELFLLVFWHF